MIKSEIVDGIAVLTLAHGKANALDIELCDALARHFAELRRSDLRAVVLTGQGKIFSAGVDLKRLSTGGADYIRRFLPALHRLCAPGIRCIWDWASAHSRQGCPSSAFFRSGSSSWASSFRRSMVKEEGTPT